ncbi:MAG: flagellar motor protein MotD [Cellvibrionaceae bacterium]
MRRRPAADININHERWLVSYADFITLLFAFFVVMYSISQVSESKYRVLSATLTEVFNEPKRALEPIQVGELSRSSDPQLIENEVLNREAQSQGAFDKTADLPQLSDQFTEQFADLIDDKIVQVNSNEYWLQISLNNSILFPLGSVKPTREAYTVLAEVADLLREFNNPIQVEGYTDNVSVSSKQFPSNWELSAARSSSVVKILVEQGISPTRLAAVGYGEHQPIAENETPAGRAQNRRVVLMIAREKTQRPRVSTQAAIDEKMRQPVLEQSQVNPQPGLEKQEESIDRKDLTSKEKMDILVESNPGIGIDSVLKLEDEVVDDVKSPTGSGAGVVTPVEKEDGGLLFSSDPELPRN